MKCGPSTLTMDFTEKTDNIAVWPQGYKWQKHKCPHEPEGEVWTFFALFDPRYHKNEHEAVGLSTGYDTRYGIPPLLKQLPEFRQRKLRVHVTT